MAVQILEIHAAAAVKVVDLARPSAIEFGMEFQARPLDAQERGIEFGVADEEGVVLGPEIPGVGEIERYPIARAYRDETRPCRSGFQPQDSGDTPRGRPSVVCRDNDVIEFGAHPAPPFSVVTSIEVAAPPSGAPPSHLD